MKFFLFVFTIYTLINLYIYRKGWKVLPTVPWIKGFYALLFFVFFSAFIIAMLGRNTFPLSVQKPLYYAGVIWLAATLYLTLYFLITDGFLLFFPKIKNSVQPRRIQVVVGYILVFVVLAVGNYRFNHPQRVEKTIVIHKDGGQQNRLTALVFSDIHLGTFIDKKQLQKYVKWINAEKPDIILIAGDIVDNNTLPLNQEKMYEELNQLQAPLGVYTCLGNHEYMSGIESSREFLRKTHWTVLVDSAAQINGSFWVIGRDDIKGNPSRKALEDLAKQTHSSQPLILLDHEPYSLEEAEHNSIDLQISGHTHRGQLFPLNLIVDRIFEVGYGYKQKKDTHIYVTSGLGLWGPPFRIGTQSEIVIFNIEFK